MFIENRLQLLPPSALFCITHRQPKSNLKLFIVFLIDIIIITTIIIILRSKRSVAGPIHVCCRNEPLLLMGLTWLQLNLLLRLPLPLSLLPLLALPLLMLLLMLQLSFPHGKLNGLHKDF